MEEAEPRHGTFDRLEHLSNYKLIIIKKNLSDENRNLVDTPQYSHVCEK